MVGTYIPSIDKPAQDVLNAAQSGGLASNLQHELDYLIPGMCKWRSTIRGKMLIAQTIWQPC